MNVTLTGRHFEITPYLKTHVDEKMQRLAHFNNQVASGEVVLFKEHAAHVAEGKVRFARAVIAAKGEGADMYEAVNDLFNKLVAQIERHEGKLRGRKRQNHESE